MLKKFYSLLQICNLNWVGIFEKLPSMVYDPSL